MRGQSTRGRGRGVEGEADSVLCPPVAAMSYWTGVDKLMIGLIKSVNVSFILAAAKDDSRICKGVDFCKMTLKTLRER